MSDTPRNACHSCRRRKLRCNKQRPCSNCQVRSLTCDEQVPEPSASGRKRTHNESDATPNILDRLARVEAYIDLQKNSDRDGSVGHPAHTHNITPEICVPAPGKRVSPSPTASDTNAARHIQEAISQRAVPLGPTSAKDNVLVSSLQRPKNDPERNIVCRVCRLYTNHFTPNAFHPFVHSESLLGPN